ncbi:MAG: hypothetical protein KAV98_00835 [Dehalococcoidia bacterium]|nr:hypothetical protein [Dehalococcoidia bacterium]
MSANKVNARQMTLNYFKAYCEKYCKNPPYKPRPKAVEAAWNYFVAFNSDPSGISLAAKRWFQENIGRLPQGIS